MALYLPPTVGRDSTRRYLGSHGAQYLHPSQWRTDNIDVLPALIGKRWDDDALKMMMAVRPSMIRVTGGEETTDSVPWRVTVRLAGDGTIESVTQQADVAIQ